MTGTYSMQMSLIATWNMTPIVAQATYGISFGDPFLTGHMTHRFPRADSPQKTQMGEFLLSATDVFLHQIHYEQVRSW